MFIFFSIYQKGRPNNNNNKGEDICLINLTMTQQIMTEMEEI